MSMKYFTLKELTRSDTAEKLGIENTPGPDEVKALEVLGSNLLDKIREAYGKPITVNVAYRCPALNKAVGGAPGSQHLKGEAADLKNAPGLQETITSLIKKGLDFDQLIIEKPDKSGRGAWLHISYTTRRKNRKQLLTL